MTSPTQPGEEQPGTRVALSMRDTLEKHATDRLAAFGVQPAQYIEATLMSMVKVPKLAECTLPSLVLSMRQAAQTGLEIGRSCYLVPYSTKVPGTQNEWEMVATFVPGYNGLIELATGTGKVVSIRTRTVHANEVFKYGENAQGPWFEHEPMLTGDKGPMLGAYAIADLRFNRAKFEWMTIEEIEAIRAKSKQWKSGPPLDWYNRKTVVKRLCKTLPQNAKLQAAIVHDDEEIPAGTFEVAPLEARIESTKAKSLSRPAEGEYGGPPAEIAMPAPEQQLKRAAEATAEPDPYTGETADQQMERERAARVQAAADASEREFQQAQDAFAAQANAAEPAEVVSVTATKAPPATPAKLTAGDITSSAFPLATDEELIAMRSDVNGELIGGMNDKRLKQVYAWALEKQTRARTAELVTLAMTAHAREKEALALEAGAPA